MLSSLQTYVPGLKALAESLYQCGEFEQSLLYYEKVRTGRRNSIWLLIGRICPSHWLRDFLPNVLKGARICSDSELTKFDLGRTICLDTLLETFKDYKFDYELVR